MLARVLLAAASAAVLVSAQVRARPGPIIGCTSNSFTIPSWYIEDLHISGQTASPAGGNASFHLVNRANNYTAQLACQAKGNAWSSCSIQGKPSSNDSLTASIKLQEASAQIMVNQTWSCNDRNLTHDLVFTAFGNNSVALSCTGPTCEATNPLLLIKGSLLSPVVVTPAYADGPTGHNAPACMASALNPYWTLSTIYFVDQPGDGPGTPPWQNFMLHLTNPGIGYEASCIAGNAIGDSSQGVASTRLTCAGGEFGARTTDRYAISTEGTFDPTTFRFSVNQTWYCDGDNPVKPVKVTVTGSDILPLECKSRPMDGNRNQTTCNSPADITMNGELVSQVALPPYAIQDPAPMADSCTLSSILDPEWLFSVFEVDYNNASAVATTANPSTISFNMILQTGDPGFQFPISISQGKPLGSDWYNCVIGGGGNTGQLLWPYECTFKYTPATKELIIKADWACSDLNPDHPIHFSGIATAKIGSQFACNAAGGGSQCGPVEAGYTFTAKISNVTWHTPSLQRRAVLL